MLILLSLGGLEQLSSLNSDAYPLRFFIHIFLLALFWAGWVMLTIALDCWIILQLFSEV